jgi:hypothetical protein
MAFKDVLMTRYETLNHVGLRFGHAPSRWVIIALSIATVCGFCLASRRHRTHKPAQTQGRVLSTSSASAVPMPPALAKASWRLNLEDID